MIFNLFKKFFQFFQACDEKHVKPIPFDEHTPKIPQTDENVYYILWPSSEPVSSLSNEGYHGKRT